MQLIATLESHVDVMAAGYRYSGAPEVGHVAYVASRGKWRRGVVVKVGRVNVTVEYTTAGAVRANRHDPIVTTATDRLARVAILPNGKLTL